MILEMSAALVYTAVFSLLITPADFTLARAMGAIDVPNDTRRMHTRPTPRLGGISIFASFIILNLILQKETAPDFLAILSGAFFIAILGIFDDSLGLSAKFKLIAQILITVAVLFSVGYSGITDLLCVIWVLTLINSHNFIDGLNGLCAGVSIIEAVGLGILFFIKGNIPQSTTAFILGGACVGFFPYNFPTAKLFMGDTGSTFLGFVLGILSVIFLADSHGLWDFIAVFLIFLFPLTDIVITVFRRVLKGQSPFAADRSHIHHLLAYRFGHRRASALIRFIAFLSALSGVLLYVIFSA